MTISNFVMLTAICAPTLQSTILSPVVLPETLGCTSRGNIYNNHQLSLKISKFKKTVTTIEQFKQNGHNFDVKWGQINVGNLKWFDVLLSDFFVSYKNFKVAQAILPHSLEPTMSQNQFKQVALQIALNYYDTASFKSSFTNTSLKEVALNTAVQVPAFVDEEWPKSSQINTKGTEQTIKTEPLFPLTEELVDAFANTTSGVHDAFTTEDSSPFEKLQE
ncbi:trwN protein [Bartonella raoultii]|uniref:TrwN protein n=1 Tax=Bartonella raoultii TaxID=1457020 RepID=A0ABS7I644_9HYPH|nr:trwN protein [Bartonella raoultii]MBX4335890.1 trwN protein [Bartonella raoultii]